MSISANIASIRQQVPEGVCLICVSKYHPISALQQAYDAGERHFGESRVQELIEKQKALPKDIHWHFIGHLQTNKVRQIVPFISLIHSVDSLRLLETIEAEAARINRVVDVLLEVHVAEETSKSGFSVAEAQDMAGVIELNHAPAFLREYPHVRIVGLMGMATNTDNEEQIQAEFSLLSSLHRMLFQNVRMDGAAILSMGMSEDFPIAIRCGSNMIRIGSSIFGERA